MDLLVLVGCVLLLIGTAAIWGWRFLVLLFLAGNLHGSFLRVPALSFPLTRGARRMDSAIRPATSAWKSRRSEVSPIR
jgi:hypothetical protein